MYISALIMMYFYRVNFNNPSRERITGECLWLPKIFSANSQKRLVKWKYMAMSTFNHIYIYTHTVINFYFIIYRSLLLRRAFHLQTWEQYTYDWIIDDICFVNASIFRTFCHGQLQRYSFIISDSVVTTCHEPFVVSHWYATAFRE